MQSPSQGLQIIAVEPATGNPGQRVLVTLRTAAELDIRGYHIAIGNVDTSVTFNSSRRDGDADYVELVALVPDLARLTSETAVPLTVYATSGNGATYGETATFLYSPGVLNCGHMQHTSADTSPQPSEDSEAHRCRRSAEAMSPLNDEKLLHSVRSLFNARLRCHDANAQLRLAQ